MQKQIIQDIEASYTKTPRNMASPDEVRGLASAITKIADALEKTISDDYQAATVSYLRTHTTRYAFTLSHIPYADDADSVLDVGGYGIFSYLLYKLRGYTNITCIDYFPDGPAQGKRELEVMGDKLTIPYMNINLDDPAAYPNASPSFNKIFFFEVLEHLINPIEVMLFLKGHLLKNGQFFVSTPNCCSLLSLHKMFCLFVPMTYNEFNPRRWDAHFREWTPFALKYLLACTGLTELCFDVFYCYAPQASFPREAFELYPFPGNVQLNSFLLGDDLFCISSANPNPPIIRPSLFYDFGAFLSDYYSIYPERNNMAWFFKGLCKS